MNAIIKASRRQALCAIVTAAALAIAPAAWGTHKTDHRYTVWGEIKYEDGTPAAEIPVKLLIANGEPLGEGAGAALEAEAQVSIGSPTEAELLLFELG